MHKKKEMERLNHRVFFLHNFDYCSLSYNRLFLAKAVLISSSNGSFKLRLKTSNKLNLFFLIITKKKFFYLNK
jgi:hypothetical protein